MGDDERRSRDPQDWIEDRGFKMAKLFPVGWETAIAELYFEKRVWAYVSLEGVELEATGSARIRNARVVVEFWREPDKPTGVWDFNLDLAGALEQLKRAEAWLLENETGRAPSTDEGLTAAGQALSRMSEEEQERWIRRKASSSADEPSDSPARDESPQ
jgi:hypothetical protein